MSSSDVQTDSVVAENLASVLSRIENIKSSNNNLRLVAVSKTKPNEMLMEAYQAGQRCFGENYVQELCGKAQELPSDIEWHFIGPLQSNKAAVLVKTVGLPQLACVESVASLKLAKKLDKAVSELDDSDNASERKLSIYLQVNTSGEDTKSGVSPGAELQELSQKVTSECARLQIRGLMTIGSPGDLSCFDTLVDCRKELADSMGMAETDLDLSMGMSGDFEEAIQRGATSVRVGSTIFGARDYSDKK